VTFRIKANQTFDCTLILIGQGVEQKLAVTFRHLKKSTYMQLLADIRDEKVDTADGILQLVEKWDADADLSRESIKLLEDEQPGADWAIITGYGEALAVARKGN
jgi:tail assembly chaperone